MRTLRRVGALLAATLLLVTATTSPANAMVFYYEGQVIHGEYIHNGPGTQYSTNGNVWPGQWWYIECWYDGTSINGDPVWYFGGLNPNGQPQGWVAGWNLATGADPIPHLPKCNLLPA